MSGGRAMRAALNVPPWATSAVSRRATFRFVDNWQTPKIVLVVGMGLSENGPHVTLPEMNFTTMQAGYQFFSP